MQRKGDFIQTHSGLAFWPLDPRPEDINIEDIAHALAMQCRYAGHGRRFYSVAEHSVLMALALPPPYRLHALLHDASEAYLVDLPSPVKRFIPGYIELEEAVMRCVWVRFNLSRGIPPIVADADKRIVIDEKVQNMAPSEIPWSIPAGRDALGVELQFWEPSKAKAEFLKLFDKLTNPVTKEAALAD